MNINSLKLFFYTSAFVKDVLDLAEVMAGAAEITNSFLEDKLLIQFVAILFLRIAKKIIII